MEDNKKLCPFCKKEIHPGDQVCIHCGQQIPNVSLNISDLTNQNSLKTQKKSMFSIPVLAILFCVLIIIIAVIIAYFFFLKR